MRGGGEGGGDGGQRQGRRGWSYLINSLNYMLKYM